MNCKKNIGLKIVSASLALAVSSVFCFPAPTTAHVINNDVLSIQLGQNSQESAVGISSDLLVEGGQTILLYDDFSELVIPITLSCDNQEMARRIGSGAVKAESSDEEKLTVTLDREEIVFEEAVQTINLTINLSGKEGNDTEGEKPPETEEFPETGEGVENETETTPESGTENETETTPESGVESETETTPESGTESETETTPESGTENETETTSESGTETVPETENVPEIEVESGQITETETAPGTEEEIPPKTGEGTMPDSETEEGDISEAVPLSAEVTFTYGEQIFSAMIVIVERVMWSEDATVEGETVSDNDAADDNEPAEDAATAALQFCPSLYHPSVEMKLVNGQKLDCTVGEFPAMTRYTLEGEKYLLYVGGNITLPAGKEIVLDLSLTGITNDLEFTTCGDRMYTIKYEEMPQISTASFPLIISEEGTKLTLSYKWGTIEPIIQIEHLTVSENGLVWQSVDNVEIKMEGNDILQFVPQHAEAGTYRATVLWQEDEITLYQMDIPFFVQYKSVGRGGTEQ